MTEYISKEAVLQKFLERGSGYIDMLTMKTMVDEIPAADVQPINPWISVDEALPIYEGLVLAVDNNNTIRLGIYTDLGWTSQFGNSMVAHITHWQPLPEPPKDGDTNG